MSVDTNLHRTFDYQLSSASLRIIDWAPVRPVAASVLQTGSNVRAYTCVDSASPNEAVTAAAYARQESAKQEAAQARVNGTEKTAVAGGGGGGGGINGDDGAARSLADQGPSDPSVADNTTTALMAAPPLYPPDFAVAAPGEDTEDSPQQQQQQQQREYSESWSGGGADIAAASPSGGLLFSHAVSPAPAAAAPVGQAERTATNSAGLLSNNGSTHNGVSINTQGPGAGGHSGAATPKTGGSGMSGATPRVCSPASSLVSSPPTLVRSKQQLGLAGNMYGFDAVYQNGSFGVLLGLFTGVGYQQTNIAYRREERVVNGGGRTPSAFPSAATAGAGTAAAAAAAAGGSNVASASNSITNRSPSDGNTTMPAGEGNGVGGSVLLACSDGALGVNSNGEASNSGLGGATTAGAGAAAATESPLTQRTRTGPVIAYKNSGGVQLSNALQCFWYWGARRWTGVLNFRFTPLLSGDAILPVCECVLRTGITENSILIDDPVVYLHSFVVLLGRRKRTPDDAQAKASAVSGAAHAGTSHHPHPIALDAADRVSEHATVNASEHAEDAGQARRPASARDDGSHVSRASTRTASSSSSGASGLRPSPTAADPDSATTTASLPRQQSSHGASRPPAARADVSHREGRSSSALPVSTVTHASAATESATKEMSWYDWYQQCMMDTSDEWLWNRAASEVVADVARSTTPWWRLRRVKTGVGLSVRYRKPRGINVYWGWSAQLGRGTSLSGHVDVLRRMSCSISSSFGYLDLSVRLRVNLVTLHQTALDAGLCWRPLQHVPEFAVRVATSASGTTLGVEMADLAPRLYTPLVDRLARYRAQRQQHHGEEASDLFAESGQAIAAASTAAPHAHNMDNTAHASTSQPQQQQQQQRHDGSDGSREDLVGLLPVTWHYLRGWGSTITYAYSGVAGAIANTWSASTSSASSHTSPSPADAQSKSAADSMRATSPPLPVPPAFASAPPTPSLTPHANLSGVVTPVSRASMHYLRSACTYVADLGWLESMLRASHVNVSMGVTSESGRLSRNWSFFLVLSEK